MATWGSRNITNEHILPDIDTSIASEEVQSSFGTLPLDRNIFKASTKTNLHCSCLSRNIAHTHTALQLLANAPNYYSAFMSLLARCFSETKALSPIEWQVTVLSTSVLLNAPYEWDINAPLAKLLPGWTNEKFEAIKRVDSQSEGLSIREQLILGMIKDLATSDRVNASTMQQLLFHFTNEEVMEIFFVHGIYSFLARTMNSCEIDYDEPIPDLESLLAERFAADIQRESSIVTERAQSS